MANQHEIDRLIAVVNAAATKHEAASGIPDKAAAKAALEAAQQALAAEKAR